MTINLKRRTRTDHVEPATAPMKVPSPGQPGSTLCEGYRVGASCIPKQCTIAEVITHDILDLGHDLHVPDEALQVLGTISGRQAIWLCPTAARARSYDPAAHLYCLRFSETHPGIVLCGDARIGFLVLNTDGLDRHTLTDLTAALSTAA